MKTNYKATDRVRIINEASPFFQLEGEVLTNNTETKDFKQLSVDLKPCGTWQFGYHEVEPLKKEKEVYPFDEPHKIIIDKPNGKLTIKIAAKSKPTKRAYNKKAK